VWAKFTDDRGRWVVGLVEPSEFHRSSSCRILVVVSGAAQPREISYATLSSVSDAAEDDLAQYIADLGELIMIASRAQQGRIYTVEDESRDVKDFLREKHRAAVDRWYEFSKFGADNEELLERLKTKHKETVEDIIRLWKRAESFDLLENRVSFALRRRLYS
jgi:hypothetical protein